MPRANSRLFGPILCLLPSLKIEAAWSKNPIVLIFCPYKRLPEDLGSSRRRLDKTCCGFICSRFIPRQHPLLFFVLNLKSHPIQDVSRWAVDESRVLSPHFDRTTDNRGWSEDWWVRETQHSGELSLIHERTIKEVLNWFPCFRLVLTGEEHHRGALRLFILCQCLNVGVSTCSRLCEQRRWGRDVWKRRGP